MNKDIPTIVPEEVITTYRRKVTGEVVKERKDWEAKGRKNEDMAQDVKVFMPTLYLYGESKSIK